MKSVNLFLLFLLCADSLGSSPISRQVVTARSGGIDLLASPVDGSPVVYTVSSNEELTVEEEKDGWFCVILPDSAQGWIYSELVENGVVIVSRVKIRSGPGLQFRAMGELDKGARVRERGRENDWVRISAPASMRGWIRKQDILPDQKAAPVQAILQDETIKAGKSRSVPEEKTSQDSRPFPVIGFFSTNTLVEEDDDFDRLLEKRAKRGKGFHCVYTGVVVRAWWAVSGKSDYALISNDSLFRRSVLCFIYRQNETMDEFVGNKIVAIGEMQKRKGSVRPVLRVGSIELLDR